MSDVTNENKGQDTDAGDLLQRALVQRGPENGLDLSLLSEEQKMELAREFQSGLIDVRKRAVLLKVDIEALSATLRGLSDTSADVSGAGNSITISHTQDSSAGRTEILIGNTKQSWSGKFSRSQTGETDWTPYMIGGGVIAVIVVALALMS